MKDEGRRRRQGLLQHPRAPTERQRERDQESVQEARHEVAPGA